jgi:hypothetical protein
VDRVLTLIRRGCDPNIESNRGLTPLLTLLITDSPTEHVEELVAKRVNVNAVNRFGITPLMLACRLKDIKFVHVLMRNGAYALQTGGMTDDGYASFDTLHELYFYIVFVSNFLCYYICFIFLFFYFFYFF